MLPTESRATLVPGSTSCSAPAAMLSHTATGEWQSFESRMRRRRAERLALKAEVAASAGFDDDARACLAEARMLAPDLPEIAVAEAVLARQPEPIAIPAEVASRSRSAFLVSATACILMAAFVAGWFAYRDGSDVAPAEPAQVVAAAGPAPAARIAVAPPPATLPEPVRELVAEASAPSPAHADAAAPREVKAPEPEPTPRESSAKPPSVATSEGLPTLPDVATATPPPAPPARVEAPPPAPPAAPTAGLGGTVLPAPSVDVKAPVVEVAQEPLVQSVLNRYAAAYSSLDADAAARVWPTVNRGSLARAFDGLAKQRVSLGDCRIDVTGNKARARCAGSATWSPKVGSGTHTESREWTFELMRVGPDWQILNARAQNR